MVQSKNIIAVVASLLSAFIFTALANSSTVQRSSFIVKNLSCTSCLATIEADLKEVPGTLGMDSDLRSGRVTVDHLSSLDNRLIADRISKLGYPAALDWTATVSDQYTRGFTRQNSFSSSCSGGGCSVPGGAGPTAWKDVPAAGTVSRTTLQVSNLSCTSCLANIAAELGKLSDTYGMNGYLSRGIVIVDHAETLENSRIAAIISDLGYPARILATNEIPVQKAFSANQGPDSSGQILNTSGFGCSSNGPCNATAASWIKLYKRYFNQTNSK